MRSLQIPTQEQRRDQLRNVAISVINTELQCKIPKNNIISISRLGKPILGAPIDKRPIVLEVDSDYTKSEIFRALTVRKPRRLYAADFLTRNRRNIMETLLRLKKSTRNKIHKLLNGTISIQLVGSDASQKITTQKELDTIIAKITA